MRQPCLARIGMMFLPLKPRVKFHRFDDLRQLRQHVPARLASHDEPGAMFARNYEIDPFERPQGENREQRADRTERQFSTAEAESDHRHQPQGRCGRHPRDEFALLEDGAAADEADAGENAQGQAHRVHHGKGFGRLPAGRQQEVGQDHRHGSGEPDQDRGSKARSMAARAAIEADDDAGKHCQPKADRDVSPGGKQQHVHGAAFWQDPGHSRSIVSGPARRGRQSQARP